MYLFILQKCASLRNICYNIDSSICMATPVFFLMPSEKNNSPTDLYYKVHAPHAPHLHSLDVRCKNQSFTDESMTLLSWTSWADVDSPSPPGDSCPAGKCGVPLRPPGCACWWVSGSPPTIPCGSGAHPGKRGKDGVRPSWTVLNRSVTTVINLTPFPGSSCCASSSTAPSGGPGCCPAWRQQPGHRRRPAAGLPVSPPSDLHARVTVSGGQVHSDINDAIVGLCRYQRHYDRLVC